MDTVILIAASFLFGAVASLTAFGSGYLLMPVFMDVTGSSSTASAAYSEAINTLTSCSSLYVEKQYETIDYQTAWRGIALSLPGTWIGTVVSTWPFYSGVLWILCGVASLLLLAAAWHTAQKKSPPVRMTGSSYSFTWGDAWIHFGLGALSAATGVGGQLFLFAWLTHQLGMPAGSALPTAQFTATFVNSSSFLEHLAAGFSPSFTEIGLMAACTIAAWYGARIAHFYSSGTIRFLYVSICFLTAAAMMWKALFRML